MKKLDDNRRIRDLNAIPKSHDSGAVHPGKWLECLPWQWAKCQNRSITGQLKVGIRAFDLRFRKLENGTINIPHCFLSNYTLTKVLIEIDKFLEEHPSEIVFLFFKREWNTREQWTEKDTRYVWKKINRYKTIEQSINNNSIVGSLRGKIVPVPEYFIFNHLCKGKLNAYDNLIVNNSWSLKSLCSVTSNIKKFLLEWFNLNKTNRNKYILSNNECIEITKKILFHVKEFFYISNNNSKTRKYRKITGNFTRKNM